MASVAPAWSGMSPGGVQVCGGCGVVAPTRGSTCAVCRRPLATSRAAAPRSGDITWVALRCAITCRSCGFLSPLAGIELDQGVDCAQCGSFQRFDKADWGGALSFAHAVGDLAGPEPEGRFPSADVWIGDQNPHRAVGETLTFAEDDAGAMHVQAAPGHPVCPRCAALLELHFAGMRVATRCPRCAATAQYELPAEALHYAGALRAVVAMEQRIDRAVVRVQHTQAGLLALTCPQCGAGVRPTDAQTVECAYCRTIAFLPDRARPRTGDRIAEPIVFWVAFQGSSSRRAALEQPTAPAKSAGVAALGLLTRGLRPLPGIELAPVRPGLDVRQLGLTTALALLALALGFTLLTIGVEARLF
ncbi:uncharacterized protein SOCE26_060760 [Sorangium cellulosum]|uniref:Double zinc ribbon n=1 Tax=Sorangium cellulosum TaxID=56 RepID=A0A2L0EZ92_SORCE|nr:hypothetical protein [Sorangium cellulosum]AUX44610.1 uncharacterized protein SOCE26_060760 [Sorangium cellulosum]